jgi:hypothetical protein
MTSCAFLKDGVVVKSEGGSAVTTIDLSGIKGPQAFAILALELPSESTSIEGFNLVGPNASGMFVFLCGNVTVRDCAFRDFDAGPVTGGAVIAEGDASFADCTFANCTAHIAGAIWHSDGHLALTGCTFTGCNNCAVVSDEVGAPNSVHVEACEFFDNWSDEEAAGALFISKTTAGAAVVDCLFKGNVNFTAGSGALELGQGPKTVENCIFIENGSLGAWGGGLRTLISATVRGCTFVDNYKAQNDHPGSAMGIGWGVFENNIFFGGSGGAHVYVKVPESTESDCNVLWGNPAGAGYSTSPTDREVDPLFCDVEALDLRLGADSPCLPDDPLGCGLIGAFQEGCGATSAPEVPLRTWGQIKGLYR